MPTERSRDLFGFAPVEGREVVAAFDGTVISRDEIRHSATQRAGRDSAAPGDDAGSASQRALKADQRAGGAERYRDRLARSDRVVLPGVNN